MIAWARLRAARLLAACPAWQTAVGHPGDAEAARAASIIDVRSATPPEGTHAIVHQPTLRLRQEGSRTWSHETSVVIELLLQPPADASTTAAGDAADALGGALLADLAASPLATPCADVQMEGPVCEPGDDDGNGPVASGTPFAGWHRCLLTITLTGAVQA